MGRDKRSLLHLWVVPVRVGGFEAAVDGTRLRVTHSGDAPPALLGAEFERSVG